ncbi:zinc-binding dehydrogenase [Streptomyces luteosporeus]|uniref:Zinc-binding dehydrogenase n=2 Tax=Streptomyces TaxID=1883 RepID=A0ABN3TZF9_9ACTN
MRAVIHHGQPGTSGLRPAEVADPEPRTGWVRVRLRAAGLNHRDLFLMDERTGAEAPFVPGSDGAGIVDAVGEGVSGVREGDEVLINPALGWEHAHDTPVVPEILGGPADGTLAECVVVPACNLARKPAHLSWPEAAALPMGALTAYRAVFTRGGLRRGEHLLVPGVGGGVGGWALLLGKAAGARVTVTSRKADKRDHAVRLGADRALDTAADWAAELGGASVDLVVDGVGPAVFGQYPKVLRPGGRVVLFGATTGTDLHVPLRELFFHQFSLLGTSMGSAEEFRQMLAFVEQHRIRPVVDSVYTLENVAEAYEQMVAGTQFGNIVVVP